MPAGILIASPRPPAMAVLAHRAPWPPFAHRPWAPGRPKTCPRAFWWGVSFAAPQPSVAWALPAPVLPSAEPLADGGHANPQRRSQVAPGQHLTVPAGQQREKAPEGREIPDGRDGANVPLQVS